VVDIDGEEVLVFENDWWRLKVRLGQSLSPYHLYSIPTGQLLADQHYCYQLAAGPLGPSGYVGPTTRSQRVETVGWALVPDEAADHLVIEGRVIFSADGPTDIRIEHTFSLFREASRLEERISLVHRYGRDRHELSDLRFGFRKLLFDRQRYTWVNNADRSRLVPVPFGRHIGQSVDHRMASYAATDLVPNNWAHVGLPDRAAEAWIWADDKVGFISAKYSQEHIEFGVADGELVAQPGRSAGIGSRPIDSADENLCLRFGGVGIARGCPEKAATLCSEQRLSFGVSIYEAFGGEWTVGLARYKDILNDRGHGLVPTYRSRLHWNELYNLGWRCGSNEPLQELPALWAEAELAKSVGAEVFYFDPGWDLHEGSSVWDTSRLGDVGDFVTTLRSKFGLELALHVMVHTKSTDEDPRIYRRRRDGEIDLWSDDTPYAGGYICPASQAWQEQKTARLAQLAQAGVAFFMFDFVNYGRAVPERYIDPGSEVPSCWSSEHGHNVPLTRGEHAAGIMAVVCAVKKLFPHVVIEAHDRIGDNFAPLYYQHGRPFAHDELWGFEYMWDPYLDLLSGKALSLYEYNLAYDIPLYLHLNSSHDSGTWLAFWWYASCCRHLGIGGLTPESPAWPGLLSTVRTYHRLYDFLARGDFVGIDVLAHGHVLRDRSSAVIIAFNLGASKIRRELVVDKDRLGLSTVHTVSGADVSVRDGNIVIGVEIGPMSPTIVELNVPSGR
jgi:hypothetical protein